ncbi:unnamed protein product [Microthlaspi erraticum]|uniref:Uncharacterized protein n=1 Tax=Microthlaspi erraticum TaxID=1685480 RepID=A0A6D2KUK3_9BRAS|nr:unnamed protein product [Microthlaspi erraticum]
MSVQLIELASLSSALTSSLLLTKSGDCSNFCSRAKPCKEAALNSERCKSFGRWRWWLVGDGSSIHIQIYNIRREDSSNIRTGKNDECLFSTLPRSVHT